MRDLIKQYKLNLSKKQKQKCIKDIEEYFFDDEWCVNNNLPLYQTHPILFERTEDHWVYLKKKYTDLFCSILNKQPFQLVSWAYVSFVGKKGSLGDDWHSHESSGAKNHICSVTYLQYEKDTDGTMFRTNDFVIMPLIKNNFVYTFPSNILHTPCFWNYSKYSKNRIVLIVDAIF